MNTSRYTALYFDIFLLYSRIFLSFYDKLPDTPKNAVLKPFYFSLYATPFYNLVPSVYFEITFFIIYTVCILPVVVRNPGYRVIDIGCRSFHVYVI